MIELPPELKQLAEPLNALIELGKNRLRDTRGSHAIDYASIEVEVEKAVAEVERQIHGALLQSLDVDAPFVEINGKEHRRVHRAEATYFTMAGPTRAVRTCYRPVGSRTGRTVDSISLRTGAYGSGWLPKTAQAIAHAIQSGTPRGAAASAQQSGRLPYSVATFDRVAHQLGEHWVAEHADIEDQLARTDDLPAVAHSISVALDRVSVPMEEPRKRPPGRPRKGAPANPITRQFRMAYVGTVTLHDEAGKSLRTLRFGRMPSGDPGALCESMANEVYTMLGRKPGLFVSLLADGAPEMWSLLEAAFPEELFGLVSRRIDFWHLAEKLYPAAVVIFGEANGMSEWRRWKDALRKRNRAAQEILDQLIGSGMERLVVNGKQPVHEAITYIDNHHEKMNYAAAIRAGLPIGSGNVEATCKTLVAVRMKRAGARWKAQTGEHVIRLRALAMSDRWDSAMGALHATRRTSVKAA